jgi:hypothetical protein
VLRLLLITLIALFPWQAGAQVYKHIDEKGNITFSDQAAPGATPVEINTPNTSRPPSTTAFPTSATTAESDDEAAANNIDYKVSITNPADETIIPRGPGNFSLSASVSPSLKSGHTVQLLMDGAPRQEPQTQGNWALTNVFRGEHKLAVAVIDKSGKTLATSEAVTVYVFRPSSNNRSRKTPR